MVGYGTQKKANLTGAVATVDVNKTLDSRPIADIGRGLQGSVPGVNITIPTGEIGSDPLIKIRGQIGSISGNNTPLICWITWKFQVFRWLIPMMSSLFPY